MNLTSLKNLVINTSIRVHKFVEEHIKYLIGRVIIADINIPQKTIDISTNIQSSTYSDFQDNSDSIQEDIMSPLQNSDKRLDLIKSEENASTISFECDNLLSDKENVDDTKIGKIQSKKR